MKTFILSLSTAVAVIMSLAFYHPYKLPPMKEYVVKKSIRIKAQPTEVWDALTNPERTKNYFFNCKVYSDWKPGSEIVFKGRMFLIKKIEIKGTILELQPNRLLKYKLTHREGEGSSTVTDD